MGIEEKLVTGLSTDSGICLKKSLDDFIKVQKQTGLKFKNIRVQFPINKEDGLEYYQPPVITFNINF